MTLPLFLALVIAGPLFVLVLGGIAWELIKIAARPVPLVLLALLGFLFVYYH
jgi:hypothetical protein